MRIAKHGFVAVSFLLLMAPRALAQDTEADYVFNVPVRIENATHLLDPIVRCHVQAYDSAGQWLGSPEGSSAIPLVGGAYRGTVRIEVRLPVGITRRDVIRWVCDLGLLTARDPAGRAVSIPGSNRAAGYTTVTGQRVASSVLLVSRELPR